jgi:hypothetical protein
MRLNFLMAFALVNRVQSFSRGIFEAPKEGIPGIVDTWRGDPALLPLRNITVSHIRAPMEIGGVKKDESGRSWGTAQHTLRSIWGIMTV